MSNTGKMTYKVGFDFDKQSLAQLKNELKEIQKMSTYDFMNFGSTDAKSMKEASKQLIEIKKTAGEVERALEGAFNQDLGVTNLTKLSNSLKNIGIEKIQKQFVSLGTSGSSAFKNLTTSLITTNTQLKQSHKLLDDMATSFKNTVKWGISSSVFNNMTSSLQKSWTYVKRLDSSLNNIRVVSGESAEQMNKFATYANRAAQALGASTLDYTNAALIYYQQGLSGDEVTKRADATVKLANVTGQSAKDISNYMTAIWNNFDTGSKSLEYYADVLAALGAKTASSSEEIATGLEKFSSIGKTVGLSYEYAAAALATITATTRQSADTVGTALKTLFARIQDLELGETLEDGTTLGKYSQALEKVGINIKDSAGNLKTMDSILDEMGKKWKTLSNDQQSALAQAIAGTRQYSQVMSLMNNWDFMTENIQAASSATGTLEEQQKTYLESTQAHLDKLSTSAERLMSALFNTKDVNGLVDGLTDITTLFANLIESVGGGRNAFLMLGSVGMQVFSNQISQGINTTISNMQTAKRATEDLNTALENLKGFEASGKINGISQYQSALNRVSGTMTDEQRTKGEELIQRLNVLLIEAEEKDEGLRKAAEILENLAPKGELGEIAGYGEEDGKPFSVNKDNIFSFDEYVEDAINKFKIDGQRLVDVTSDINGNILQDSELKDILYLARETTREVSEFKNAYNDLINQEDLNKIDIAVQELENLSQTLEQNLTISNDLQGALTPEEMYKKQDAEFNAFYAGEKASNVLTNLKKQASDAISTVSEKMGFLGRVVNTESSIAFKKFSEHSENAIDKTKSELDNFINSMEKLSQIKAVTNMIAGFGQLGASITAVGNLVKIWNNDSLTTMEKAMQIFANITTTLPLLANAINLVVKNWTNFWSTIGEGITLLGNFIFKTLSSIAANKASAKSEQELQVEIHKTNTLKTVEGTVSTDTKIANTGKEIAANKALAKSEQGVQMAQAGATEGATALAGAEAAGAEAAGAGATATLGLGASLATVAAVAAIVVAVVALLAYGIYRLVKAYNKDKDAAEAAAEAVKELSSQYDKCKQSADKLRESISKYSEVLKAFEEMDSAAENYKETLEEVNKQAKLLIEEYGLFGDYTVEDGVIKFKDGVLEGIQNEKDSQARSVENALNQAQIYSNQANARYDSTKIRRSVGSMAEIQTDEDGIQYVTGYSDLTSKEIDSLSKIIGDFEGDVVKNRDDLKNVLLGDNSLSDTIKFNIDSILDNAEAFKAHSKMLEENEKANEYYSKQIMKNMISEGKNASQIDKMAQKTDENGNVIVDQARKNQIQEIAAQWASKDTAAMNKELEAINVEDVDSNSDLKKYGIKIKNDEDLAKTYAQKVLGINLEKSQFDYTGGNNKGSLKNNKGEEIFTDLSDDIMRRELAKYAAREKIQKKYSDKLDQTQLLNNLDTAMKGMEEFGKKYGTDFTDAFLNAATSESKQLDLTSLYAFLDPDEIEELGSMSGEEWLTAMGLTEQQLKDMGFSSSAEFANSFKEGLTNYKWDAGEAVSAALRGKENEIEGQGLDVEEFKQYSEYLMGTAESADELADSLKHDADASIVVAQSIMRMNNGVKELSENFEDWQDILTKSESSSEEYFKAFSKMQHALGDLLDVEDKFITDNFIQKHMKDIEKAAKGDEKAIDKLHKELAKAMVLDIANNNNGQIIDGEALDIDIKSLQDKLNSIDIPDVKVGTSLDFSEMDQDMQTFTKNMMEIVNDAHMTTEEANAFFRQMGFEAKFATKREQVTRSVPIETTESEITSIFPLKMTSRTYQSGTESVTQWVDVPAMSTDGKDPKVKLTKLAGGAFNNSSSKNKGGGGSKKGGSQNNTSKIDAEKDLYEKVNVQLGKTAKTLSKIQGQTERLTGLNLVKNLVSQTKLLNEEIGYTNDKLKIMYGEQSDLQNKLSSTYGAKFDAEGVLTNYSDIFDKEKARANKVLENKNSTAKQREAAQKRWDNFEKWYQRYDTLVSSEIPEQLQKIQDDLYKQIDNKIKALNLELEVRVDIKDFEETFNEFYEKVLNPNGYKKGSAIAVLEQTVRDFNALFDFGVLGAGSTKLDEILTNPDVFTSSDAESMQTVTDEAGRLEELRSVLTDLMSNTGDLEDFITKIGEGYRDVISEVSSEMEDQLQIFEQMATVIDQEINRIKLMEGDFLASTKLKDYFEKKEASLRNRVAVEEQQLTVLAADYERTQTELADAVAAWEASKTDENPNGNLELQYIMEEAQKTADAAWDAYFDKMSQLATDYESLVNVVKESAINAIDATFAEVYKSASNFSYDYLNQEWQLLNENADLYLDSINRAYNIQKIANKYNEAIDTYQGNISAQRKLNELKEIELDYLREADHLSEHDIERAEKKYEIALKEMELEEAKQNKTNLRLRRDSQGNYTYQYGADENNISKLQNELGDLYNSLYNFDKEADRQITGQILELMETYRGALDEAMNITDAKEREERLALVRQEFEEKYTILSAQQQRIRSDLEHSALSDTIYMYGQNEDAYKDMTEAQQSALEAMLSGEKSSIESAFNNLYAKYNEVTGEKATSALKSFSTLANSAASDFVTNLRTASVDGKEIFDKIGEDVETLHNKVKTALNGDGKDDKGILGSWGDLGKVATDTATKIEESQVKITDSLVTGWTKATTAASNYFSKLVQIFNDPKVQQMIADLKDSIIIGSNTYIDDQKKNGDEVQTGLGDIIDAERGSGGDGSGNEGGQDPNQGNGGNQNSGETWPYGKASATAGLLQVGSRGTGVKAVQYALNKLGFGNSGTSGEDGIFGSNTAAAVKNFQKWVKLSADGIVGNDTRKKFAAKGYDTGGYTGSWGPEGKLAFLHQKELVLNAKDTENILAAVGALRLMNQAMLSQLSAGNIPVGGNGLEQNVHIEANFPNATNHNEIEEALRNLVNAASQRTTK